MKEINLTPAQPSSEEKKNIAFKKLIDKGKQSGHLSTQDIDTIIVELDLDVDELENSMNLLIQQISALLMTFRQKLLTESALKLICQKKPMRLKPLRLMIMRQWMTL